MNSVTVILRAGLLFFEFILTVTYALIILSKRTAGVAEQADARDSNSRVLLDLWVRFPPPALNKARLYHGYSINQRNAYITLNIYLELQCPEMGYTPVRKRNWFFPKLKVVSRKKVKVKCRTQFI